MHKYISQCTYVATSRIKSQRMTEHWQIDRHTKDIVFSTSVHWDYSKHQRMPSSSLPFQEPSFGPSWRSLAPPPLKHWSLSSFPVSVSIATHRWGVWWQHPPKLSLPVQFLQDQTEVLPAKFQIILVCKTFECKV